MRLELSHWPLAVTRLEGRATIEHLDAYFHDFEARVMKALHWVVPPRVPTSFEPDFSAAIKFTSRRLIASDVDIAPIAHWIARECG